MKKLILAVTLLTLGAVALAQSVGAPNLYPQVSPHQEEASQSKMSYAFSLTPDNSLQPDSCPFPFTTGAGSSFLAYCVLANGNIVQIESPQGHPLISSDLGEGYGFCDLTTQTAYNDYAAFGDSGNLLASVVQSHTAKSIKIARSTVDGFFTLTQTITKLAGPAPSIKIVMTLKNNTADARHMFLLRYADVDADGLSINNFDVTMNSAFGYSTYGLLLQNIGPANFRHTGVVSADFRPPDPCGAFNGIGGVHQVNVDGAIRHAYDTTLAGGGALTVTLIYKGM